MSSWTFDRILDMVDKQLKISLDFEGDPAAAGEFARELQTKLQTSTRQDVHAELKKGPDDGGDLGSIISLVLPTPFVTQLATAISQFLLRYAHARIILSADDDQRIVLHNLDAGGIVKALTKVVELPGGPTVDPPKPRPPSR
jgi:hypothetical protein